MIALSSILKSVRHAVALLVLLLAAGAASAQPTNISASLAYEQSPQPGGTVTLAIHMKPGPGWHGYWQNPGDAGLGMTLDWKLPQGWSAGAPQYPVPQTLLISGLMNHVYKGDYALLVPVSVPASAKPGSTARIALDAKWLACTDEICVPESGVLELALPVAEPGGRDARFETWRTRLPAPLGTPAHFALAGDTVRFGVPLPASIALDDPHLFIADSRVVDYAAPQRISRNGDMLVIELKRPSVAPASPEAVQSVLRLGKDGVGLSFTATPGEVPPAGAPLDESTNTALPFLFAGALLGGLLLNLMPCVFPILSLKAMSLVRAGESETSARREGLAYTGGVVLACLALGALLLALRAAGEQVGWAFQLQEPAVVAVLLLLAVAITANFIGLFEVSMPGLADDGSGGAFATGLLAAFVATPCTGPFMAAAMGAALLLPVVPAMALFAALGLGLALPFLALGYVPALRRLLPRPGPWMVTFRHWMALPMGLTALALAWLAWRIGGAGFALVACLVALACMAGLWRVGRLQRAGRPAFATALAAILVPLLAASQLGQLAQASTSRHEPGLLAALPFSEVHLASARASGKPVFVWMTADWCITCKVNESAAIEREATAAAFSKAGVTVLRGDWTRRDPAITRYLTAHGAAGVPFYQWYPPGGGAPEQLPQVLTEGLLVERSTAQGR